MGIRNPIVYRCVIVWLGVLLWGSLATMDAQLGVRVRPVVLPAMSACSSAVILDDEIAVVSVAGRIAFSDRALTYRRTETLPNESLALRLYRIGPLLLAYDRSRQLFQRLPSGTWVAASEPGVLLHRDADSILYAYRDGHVRVFTRDASGKGYTVIDRPMSLYGQEALRAFGIAGDTTFTAFGEGRVCRTTPTDTILSRAWLPGHESVDFEHMPDGSMALLKGDDLYRAPDSGTEFWQEVAPFYFVYGFWGGACLTHGRDSAGPYVRMPVWRDGRADVVETRSDAANLHPIGIDLSPIGLVITMTSSGSTLYIGTPYQRFMYNGKQKIAMYLDGLSTVSDRFWPLVDGRGAALCYVDVDTDAEDPLLYHRIDTLGDHRERHTMPPGGGRIPRYRLWPHDVVFEDGVLVRRDYTGILRRNRGSRTWDTIVRFPDERVPYGVTIGRIDDTLFVPDELPGVWRSTDRGRTWKWYTFGVPEEFWRVQSIARSVEVLDGYVWCHTPTSSMVFSNDFTTDTLPFLAVGVDNRCPEDGPPCDPAPLLSHHYVDSTMFWYRIVDTTMYDGTPAREIVQRLVVTTFRAGDPSSHSYALPLPRGFGVPTVGYDAQGAALYWSYATGRIIVAYAGVITMDLAVDTADLRRLGGLVQEPMATLHRTGDSTFIAMPGSIDCALIFGPLSAPRDTAVVDAAVPPSSLVVRPNPASTSMTIVLSADMLEPGPERFRLRIVDVHGCEQRHRHGLDMAAAPTAGTIDVDLGGFTPGLYYAEVQRGALRKVVAFVVQR